MISLWACVLKQITKTLFTNLSYLISMTNDFSWMLLLSFYVKYIRGFHVASNIYNFHRFFVRYNKWNYGMALLLPVSVAVYLLFLRTVYFHFFNGKLHINPDIFLIKVLYGWDWPVVARLATTWSIDSLKITVKSHLEKEIISINECTTLTPLIMSSHTEPRIDQCSAWGIK